MVSSTTKKFNYYLLVIWAFANTSQILKMLNIALKEVISLGYSPPKLFCARKALSNFSTVRLETFVDLEKELKQTSPKFESEKHERINFDDPLYYSFTSGTTGFPKAAIIKNSR